MSDSVRHHRWQPTRLHHPWDSPGKNTGVGCHFLLQCMKVKSESEVTQSHPTLCDPMDCSLPGSAVHGIFQARVLEWVAIAFSNLIFTPRLFLFLLFIYLILIKLFILYWTMANKNIVIVSGEQRRDSAIHIHVSIPHQTPLPSRVPHNIEQSSLCYTVDPCWWPILNTAVWGYFLFWECFAGQRGYVRPSVFLRHPAPKLNTSFFS